MAQEATANCYECGSGLPKLGDDFDAFMLGIHVRGTYIMTKILCRKCWEMKNKMGGFLDVMLARDMPVNDALTYLEKTGFKAIDFPESDLKALKSKGCVQFTFCADEWEKI